MRIVCSSTDHGVGKELTRALIYVTVLSNASCRIAS